MTQHRIEIMGTNIVNKHTHYEVHPFVGPESVTIIIRGDIAADFQKKYGVPITKAEKLKVSVDLGRNDERVEECRDPFKPGAHLMGSIYSLEDIRY